MRNFKKNGAKQDHNERNQIFPKVQRDSLIKYQNPED